VSQRPPRGGQQGQQGGGNAPVQPAAQDGQGGGQELGVSPAPPGAGKPPPQPPAGVPDPDDGGEARAKEPRNVFRAAGKGVRDAFSPAVGFLEIFGEHLILCARALAWLPRRPFRIANYLESAEYIGFGSLPIILLVGAFTGMVTSLQAISAFGQFGLEAYAGGTTGKALAIELGPVLTALMLAGRASSGIATELGTMRISEQIDALESMAVNPLQFLVLPRLIAGLIMGPILTMLFFIIGMGGVYFVAIVVMHVDQGPFTAYTRDLITMRDILQGIIKGAFFGFAVCLIGCYQGYNARGGGRGVGLGTTRAVVISSVTVLVTDYFLSQLLLEILAAPQGGA
jgi:phospholipid/cholesterol/gamma-HCH transport system permease protein